MLTKEENALRARQRRIRKFVADNTDEVVDALLEHYFWLQNLKTGVGYRRRGDDTDGENNTITVIIGDRVRQGDVWIDVLSHIEPSSLSLDHCFREPFNGGGQSQRTRNALLILARAIQLDNEISPQTTDR